LRIKEEETRLTLHKHDDDDDDDSASVGFIKKKFGTMCGHMNVKNNVSLLSINRFIFFVDITIPASESHKKQINALYGTTQGCLTLQPAVNTINTGL